MAYSTFCHICSVHPRGHGEHMQPFGGRTTRSGSSPWARGTHAPDATVATLDRFIPVGTGNTPNPSDIHNSTPVHPRGHGEHITKAIDSVKKFGSSPWARGTQDVKDWEVYRGRFIPVGTGNTFPARTCEWSMSVHPRGHGEHIMICTPVKQYIGSSPWARGTPSTLCQFSFKARFIPVGTGNTIWM